MPSATGFAETSRAPRYLAQMCKHMSAEGMSVQTTGDDHGAADFGWGTCTFHAGPEALTLHIQARDLSMLERAQHVLAAHLERFGRRDGLAITWNHPTHE
jgi:hypothetical protein